MRVNCYNKINNYCRLSYNIINKRSLSLQPKENTPISEDSTSEKLQSGLTNPDYFKVSNLFTVEDLFNARVHYGHKLGSLDDRMKPYLYGHRLGHTIFDLDTTAAYLRKALNFAAHTAYRDGIVLLLVRGAQSAHLIEKTAKECNEFAHTRFWRGGVFTNANVQFEAVTRLPELCIFFSTLNTILTQHVALRDCAKMGIPSIGIVDSNCNPNLVTYPVPGNDDSPAAIKLYCNLFKQAILRGKEKRKQDIEQGILT